MRRKIKFRAWDLNLGKFVDPMTIGKLDFDDPTYVFQQFIGITDLDNQELYEGDIITLGPIDFEIIEELERNENCVVNYVDTSKPKPIVDLPFYLGVIEYNYNEFRAEIKKQLRNDINGGVSSASLSPTSYAICKIGNIFENSELLK